METTVNVAAKTLNSFLDTDGIGLLQRVFG